MKRSILFVLLAIAAICSIYAQSYTVQDISGNVQRDMGGNRWEALRVGDTLRADTLIRTLVGANLTLRSDGQILTIGPLKTGTISELAGSGSGIQIQGRVVQTDTSAAGRSTGNVVTAAARASDAAAEIELEE